MGENKKKIRGVDQEMLLTLYEHAQDLMAVLDAEEGVILECNSAFQRILGYDPEDLKGENLQRVVHPADLSYLTELLSRGVKTSVDLNEIEVRLLHKDGTFRWVRGNAVARDGKWYCIGQDITELMQERKEKQRFSEVIEATTDHVGIADADLKPIYLNHAMRGLLEDPDLDLGQLTGIALFHPAWAIQKIKEEGFPEVARAGRWQSESALLDAGGKEIPVSQMILAHYDDETGDVLYYSTICRDISDQKAAQKLLEESEVRYRSLFDHSATAKCILSPEHSILEANRKFVRLLGLKHEKALVWRDLFQYVHEKDREHLKNVLEEVLGEDGESPVTEVELIGEDSRVVNVQLQASIIPYGELPTLQMSVTDITWRKRAERALQQSEKNYRTVADGIDDSLFILEPIDDDDFICRFVNAAYYKHSALTPEQVIDRRVGEILPESHAKYVKDKFRQAVRNKKPLVYEERYERPDGDGVAIFNTKLTPQLNEQGEVVQLVGLARDVTEWLRTEQEVQRLSQVASQIDNGVVITDEKGRIRWVNKAFEQMTGYGMEEVEEQFLDSILKGTYTDRMTLRKFLRDLQQKGGTTDEMLVYDKQGRSQWFSVSASAGHDEQQQGQFFLILTDITENKKVEGQLMNAVLETQESERRKFAEELHDGLGQLLSAAQMNLSALEKMIPSEGEEAYQNTVSLIQRSVSETRVVSRLLMPAELKDFGLAVSLENMEEQVGAAEKIRLEIDVQEIGEDRFDEHFEIGVYRMVQEIITNTLKHAGASSLRIHFKKEGYFLGIRAKDDGIGFALGELDEGRGMGLSNLKKRARSLEGEASIRSRHGHGVYIDIRLPLEGHFSA